MRRALSAGFVDATEVADWLAARGVPFREAHHVSGRLVKRALAAQSTLPELTLAEFQEEHPTFDASIFAALDPEVAIERRSGVGGPARVQVESALSRWRAHFAERPDGPRVETLS